jgi:hypothetical protein
MNGFKIVLASLPVGDRPGIRFALYVNALAFTNDLRRQRLELKLFLVFGCHATDFNTKV